MIEHANLAASKLRARFRVTDGVVFRTLSSPVRPDTWAFKTLPAPSIWSNLDDRLRLLPGIANSGIMPPMKYWEVIADKLHASGWSWGCCSAVTRDGWRWIVDAHKGEGRRYIVRCLVAIQGWQGRHTLVLSVAGNSIPPARDE
jgi:hypothetical protein